MKEIILKENQITSIPNTYENDLIVRYTDEGYFITCNNKEYGPFLKVFTDSYNEFNNDIFIFGWRPEKTLVYRNGLYGLEQKDELDTTVELVKHLNKFKDQQPENTEFLTDQGCTFLGETLVYKLYKDEGNKEGFANPDGFARILLHNEKRLVFRTPQNQIFIVNPNNIKPYSSYVKFDNLEELCIAARKKSIDYAFTGPFSSVSNASLCAIKQKTIKNHLPYSVLQRILNKIKEMVGIENYRSLDFSIDYDFIKHYNFDMEEYLNALKSIDIDDLEKYIITLKEKEPYLTNGECLFRYQKNVIHPTLESASRFGEFILRKGQERTSILHPNTEKTNASFNNPNSINWIKIETSQYGEKTKQEAEICKYRAIILSQLREREKSRESVE